MNRLAVRMISHGMHKEATELVLSLQTQVVTQELKFGIERRCTECLLEDAMQANAAKEDRIHWLHDAASTLPFKVPNMPKLLNRAMLQFSTLRSRRS